MNGITDLDELLRSMSPKLQRGDFIFCSFADANYGDHAHLQPVAAMQEEEGLTLVIPKELADANNVPYESVFRCITLTVYSSLDAVGLTAAFSSQLAHHGISANVVAGHHHDHLFVNSENADDAMAALAELANN